MHAAELFSPDVKTKEGRVTTRRCLVGLFFMMILPGIARPQQPDSPAERRPYTIAVSVDNVVLPATVQNHKGILVSGLGKDDFQVYEDGLLQQITYFSHEDIPVTVGLVVDNSGSMRPKRAEVIAAALAFARSSNPADQMFVVNFNEHVSFGLPHNTPFTDKVTELEVALSHIKADGETALYDAVAAALEHLMKGNRDKKVLIAVSDGADNASKHTLAQIMAMAGRPDAIIYTIGLFEQDDPDKNPGVLRQLAKATGGEAFLPESLKDVAPICERIARDIRNQYTIAYAPANRKQDGTYRLIQVKAAAPGRGRLFVRTRAGYTAPLKTQPSPEASATYKDVQD
ncbi:MAG: VWA domain-containing protein [Acidobacteriia bacterium]|nr:VWA domain-containing protein [Terriglobia bacterium]